MQPVRIEREKNHGSNLSLRVQRPVKVVLMGSYMVRFVITPTTDKTSGFLLFLVLPIIYPVIEQDLLAFINSSCYRDVLQSVKDK